MASLFEKAPQIEVTVQQISLFHQHDFVADAAQKLRAHLPPGFPFTAVFKVA